ncbi:TlpA family protein disulfide reductase [Candidatus Poribacteria bacterium]|nr:TlpA family protein disulfide reductase [Candidatus Poribacteria bacterium]
MREFPAVERTSNRFAANGLVVLTISDDTNTEKLNEVLSRIKTTLPVLRDKESKVFSAYHVAPLPALYLLDREQKVYSVWIGPSKKREAELSESITALLNKQTAP